MCEPVSLGVTIATSCDVVSSHNRQDLIQSLVPTHYDVISLSNISMQTNNKGRIKIIKYIHVQYFKGATFCARRHVICCHSFNKVTLLFDHCTIVRRLKINKCGLHLHEILKLLSIEMKIWPWICNTLRMNEH